MKSSTERFSDRVEPYVRYRPRYPDALLNYLAAKISPPATVADIGSGTGILSDQLLQFGYPVVAVEPNKPMREAAERRLSGRKGFSSVDGTAENTNLLSLSVDAITCAQSFHWFDRAKCRAEFERILRPQGLIALIWNERAQQDPLMQQYDEVLIRFVPGIPITRTEGFPGRKSRHFSPMVGSSYLPFPTISFSLERNSWEESSLPLMCRSQANRATKR